MKITQQIQTTIKQSMSALILAIFAGAVPAQIGAADQWWSYLASYEAGPGSIRVNLAMRKLAPLSEYPHLVVTGVTYQSARQQGLPEIADLHRLNELQDRIVAAIAKQSAHVYVGTFTHNFEQLHYVYVKDPTGITTTLAKLYSEHCPGCKVYTNIKQDPSWSAYSDFLFPNQATREHYRLQL